MKSIALCFCIVFFSSCLYAQKSRYVILPESKAKEIHNLCSRQGVSDIEGTWTPNIDNITILETKIDYIAEMQVGNAIHTPHIKNPSNYYRQYIGIIVHGKKLIYINATCCPTSSFKSRMENMCDGGSSAWGILYNPGNGKFSELRTNGGFGL